MEDHFIREFNVETSAQPGGRRICNFTGWAPHQVVINLLDVASLNTVFKIRHFRWMLHRGGYKWTGFSFLLDNFIIDQYIIWKFHAQQGDPYVKLKVGDFELKC